MDLNNPNKKYLHGIWNLAGGGHNLKTEIPGDFHYSLLKENIIKDPYIGFNEQECLWVGKTDWVIEKEFEYEKKEGTKSILEITEADTFIIIYLNEKEIGKGQNEFARHRFDVTNELKNGKNKIKIVFESAERKAKEIAKTLKYPVPCSEYDVSSPNRNLVRKCQCNAGWDWGPCLMVSGIYGHIYIETVTDGIFDNVMVNYQLKDANINRWSAYVIINYFAYKETKKEFNIAIKGEDIKEVKEKIICNLKEGNNRIEKIIEVDNPWIWKTSGELYAFQI